MHAQLVLQPDALVQLLWCHQTIILLRKLVQTSQWTQTDGEAAKACGCSEFIFFPSQHCSCCSYFSGVRLVPPTGPSAMRIPWSLLVFLSLVWLKAVPIFSESELWTKLVSACHPGCQSLWLLWILQTEPGLKVRCAFYRLHERFKKSHSFKNNNNNNKSMTINS